MMVSFIIPVFNQIELTLQCISSLQETVTKIDYEIVIVDDCSNDETATQLRTLKSETIHIFRNNENLGYAKSNNIGARNAKGDYLFLLNNDLVFSRKWIEPMLSGLRKRKVGIVGNVQLDATIGEIDHSGFLFDGKGTLRHKKTPNLKGSFTEFLAVTGACLAIRKDLYHKLEGLDERYENGCEDIDLCFKAKEIGLKTIVANESTINHYVSSTRGTNNLHNESNMRLFQTKWRSQISTTMASAWPAAYLRGIIDGSESVSLEKVGEAVSHFFLNKKLPPSGKLIVEAKLKRNERHWMSILDNKTDEMIKESYHIDQGKWIGTQFSYSGFETNLDRAKGKWIKENAKLKLGAGFFLSSIQIIGTIRLPNKNKETHGKLGLRITTNSAESKDFFPLDSGQFVITIEDVPALPESNSQIDITLLGVSKSNAYAYLGRKLQNWFLIPKALRHYWGRFRAQNLNQRLLIKNVLINHEMLLDFDSQSGSPANFDFLRRASNIGINLIGWFDAELGVGESARLAAKAMDTTSIDTALVPLKVNCLASREDHSLSSRLVEHNPYPINVFHIDAPQSADIDHHHGGNFRKGKRNIAYWAWELPDFPDIWMNYFKYYDEIWTPSNFVRDSVTMKSPLPVLTIPHCIDFKTPQKPDREKFSLPSDKYLFLFAYDLNSYQPRKNPKATIRAFKKAFAGKEGQDVGLVIKTHSIEGNKEAYEELQSHLTGIENVYLIDRRLSREDVYNLMYSVDAYVSLHRAEGFGLTVAESMYLGKPVISTNWSATTEFLNQSNGCPVDFNLVELEKNFGPYTQGQIWADPSSEHAAELMRKLFEDRKFAKDLGEKAAITIRNQFSPKIIGKIYEKRLKSFALW